MQFKSPLAIAALACAGMAMPVVSDGVGSAHATAIQNTLSASDSALSYADLADLADAATIVVVAKVRKAAKVDPERTGPVRPGWARYYLEAETVSLLAAETPIGARSSYLADLPLDERGRPPRVKGETVVLFARPVAGRPGELQLVAPDAQVPLTRVGLDRLRTLLQENVAPDRPPSITGVRDIWHTPGNLAGEGETQIFLETGDGSPASIAVRRRPGRAPQWGLSTGELVNTEAGAPVRDTLAWYRLACFLPKQPPAGAIAVGDPNLRARAMADYALVIAELGACDRQRQF